MQQTAFVDPLDLMIWIHTAPYLAGLKRSVDRSAGHSDTSSDEAQRAFHLLAGHAYRPTPSSKSKLVDLVTEYGAPAIRWLVTLWHEQRHFIDYVFTNYGASQFSLAFMLRSQLPAIVQSATVEGRIAFPIDTYADSVKLEAIGLSIPDAHPLRGMASFISDRRGLLALDRKAGTGLGTSIPIDGYAVLEALGSIAQLKVLREVLETSGERYWNKLGHAYTAFPYVSTVAEYLHRNGLPVLQLDAEGPPHINDAILSPLLVACLMHRRSNREPAAEEQSAYLPSYRIRRLVAALGGNASYRAIDKLDDGFELVDQLCKKVWGRRIRDELAADIDYMEGQFSRFEKHLPQDHPDVDLARTQIAARRELLTEFDAAPLSLCCGTGYVERVSREAIPKLVFLDGAADGVVVIAGGEGFDRSELNLFDGEFGSIGILVGQHNRNDVISMEKIYCYHQVGVNEGRVFKVVYDDDHWKRAVLISAYINLFLHGRNQVAGRDFFLYLAEEEFKKAGISVKYDYGYDVSVVNRDPGYLFEMMEASELICDLSGRKVTRESSVIVSPWDFLSYPDLVVAAKAHGKEGLSPLIRGDGDDIGDWNIWLIHRDLCSFE